MNKKSLLIIGAAVLILIIACGTHSKDGVKSFGRVTFDPEAGGFFGIVADDGTKYDPVYLPMEYRLNNLRVRFAARVRRFAETEHRWGIPVDILEIKRTEQQ